MYYINIHVYTCILNTHTHTYVYRLCMQLYVSCLYCMVPHKLLWVLRCRDSQLVGLCSADCAKVSGFGSPQVRPAECVVGFGVRFEIPLTVAGKKQQLAVQVPSISDAPWRRPDQRRLCANLRKAPIMTPAPLPPPALPGNAGSPDSGCRMPGK